MRSLVGAALGLLLLAGPAAGSEAARRLIAADWEAVLAEDPLFATRIGDPRSDDRLPAVAPEDFERRLERRVALVAAIDALRPESLDEPWRTDLEVLRYLRADEIDAYRVGSHLLTIGDRSGFHLEFVRLPEITRFGTPEDYDRYIARLRAFPRYVADQLASLRQGMARGRTPPRAVVDGIAATVWPHAVVEHGDSALWAPFEAIPAGFDEATRDRLRAAGAAAIREDVVPALRAFGAFLEGPYRTAARTTIAAAGLPDGRDLYRHRIRHFTSLDVEPGEAHQIGLREVARLRSELRARMRDTGHDGGFDAFVRGLRSDARFRARDDDALLGRIDLTLERIGRRLPERFGRLPVTPLEVRRVPEALAPRAAAAYYEPPTWGGARGGTYFVNTHDLPSRRLHELDALTLHEAIPGHHLQFALQQEARGLASFRRHARIPGFVEGWAFYAEGLGADLGLYDDPHARFGAAAFEMWRALRLAVDTGIHWQGWPRRKAVEFMAANSALSRAEVEKEVDRCIAWPGQAAAYTIGRLEIERLRERARDRLGEAFDVREFHDTVLGGGAVPFAVLERRVERWISRRVPAGSSPR